VTIDFRQLTDVAQARLGARAISASDEFFAPKERLLAPGRAFFDPDRYTDRGKWMDGWETRRKRGGGHDWCVIRLAVPSVIRGVVVDTSHFKGNHPAACSVDAAGEETGPGPVSGWHEILGRMPLEPHAENRFEVASHATWAHVRLNIYPDGGVARFRVHGEPHRRWTARSSDVVDLAAALAGGVVLACSDMFFSEPHHLLLPDRSIRMDDGWETRRRRGPGHDWCVIRLAARGTIEAIDVDTSRYKGNYPDRCSLECADDPDAAWSIPSRWREIVPESKLGPDRVERFEASDGALATHVRFNMHPDGGVARLRIWGRLAEGSAR
jgi:allantoicase